MIHYNRLKLGQALLVTGMVAVPRRRDGEIELVPPVIGNGELVKVVTLGVDSVTVENAAGKQMTLAHGTGAQRLKTPERQPEPEPALAREARELSGQAPNPADEALLRQRQLAAKQEQPVLPPDSGRFKLPGADE